MRLLWISLLMVVPVAGAGQQSGDKAQPTNSDSWVAAPGAVQSTDMPIGASVAGSLRTEFHVRYVNGNNVYIDAGRNAGLEEGTKLVLKQAPANPDDNDAPVQPGVVAKLTVISVASTSSVCQVDQSTRDLAVGDTLSLPDAEVEQRVARND